MKRQNEPAAIRELRRIRQQMLAEEKRIGSDRYWEEANHQAKEFARRNGLRYVETRSNASVSRTRPAKNRGSAALILSS